MVGVLAVVLLALAAFTVMVVRRSATARGPMLDRDQLLGFTYVGAGGLTLVAVAVLVLGALAPTSARAESVAVLGLFGYLLYSLVALAILLWPIRPRAGRRDRWHTRPPGG